MKPATLIIIAALIVCIPLPVFGFQPPDNYKGIKFGGELRKMIPECVDDKSTPLDAMAVYYHPDESCWIFKSSDGRIEKFTLIGHWIETLGEIYASGCGRLPPF